MAVLDLGDRTEHIQMYAAEKHDWRSILFSFKTWEILRYKISHKYTITLTHIALVSDPAAVDVDGIRVGDLGDGVEPLDIRWWQDWEGVE